ncbi:diaminobutyrate--2-oxoglutarate transaminase [Mesorhizobium sp. M7A.T.Ca.TU.009.01.3.2]|jgi:diaminobutyrate-2-oxoglutarate transaminase|uniref:diaminobutyrate--2-oxoglutarate transaminase n=2 Tax=Phyllobacteriaceae TaxID=69277 RepID=UPI0007A95B21|nr:MULTISPECIES: diaminobutyrate--2-oxoglutarate transaminase [Mesorhizobium]RUU24416.1 diaminobutyrate--2-oxoglutarate transaminase [Mesorhizobium sp. M7A.T.Ca.TU.009.01.3.2]RUV14452.1 diaminobutyrate--2-oxoglutarate transaminase [Mesorhizobium sp. M7A.T.Ca.TU.009.01.3.1]RUZ91270.1 diaminobutyrate--2-oxoglutarate transaminase [Mesorhizobium sp. M7A.F.Ca.US.003.02.2.1]RVA55063.1 diaminobutyrate--2-oxoglutarate transaminase [Mesorhizobium sp. M7A.F.Ca.US.001.01.1.1]WIE92693.1 diaminobutyrate--2
MDTDAFTAHESNVRRYCRAFPTVFTKALGATIWDETGKPFIDFLVGSGALNYGHNNPDIMAPAIEYLVGENILLSLDMHTAAKRDFIEGFVDWILKPRGLSYKIQFPGPTGTNANEAALALARKYTGRSSVMAFTNAFHGMSLGSLAVSGSASTRELGGVARHDVIRVPYDGYPSQAFDSASYIDSVLSDPGSGIEKPAAIILETIQAEGGMNAASAAWLTEIQRICRTHGIVFIVDDIQAGAGRTGDFFSFESAKIEPDIVCLSKSLSGSGSPLSIVLIRPDLDIWKPGEHSGTFRGNNFAFVTAGAMCKMWSDRKFTAGVERTAVRLQTHLDRLVAKFPRYIEQKRGRGLMAGLKCRSPAVVGRVHDVAFENGLLIESSGPNRDVIKVLPPITITDAELDRGITILEHALQEQDNA